MTAPWRIGLLRAVNLGPHNKAPSAALRALAVRLGYGEPETLLASGNLIFRSDADPDALEAQLEAALAAELGLKTEVLVRTPEAWSEAVAANPYPQQAADEPNRTLLFTLKTSPTAEAIAKASARLQGAEALTVIGRHAYAFFDKGVGVSKFDPLRLGVATGRNWNTVLKLQALATR